MSGSGFQRVRGSGLQGVRLMEALTLYSVVRLNEAVQRVVKLDE